MLNDLMPTKFSGDERAELFRVRGVVMCLYNRFHLLNNHSVSQFLLDWNYHNDQSFLYAVFLRICLWKYLSSSSQTVSTKLNNAWQSEICKIEGVGTVTLLQKRYLEAPYFLVVVG